MMVSWNTPHGPDDGDYRYKQVRNTLGTIHTEGSDKTNALWQEYFGMVSWFLMIMRQR